MSDIPKNEYGHNQLQDLKKGFFKSFVEKVAKLSTDWKLYKANPDKNSSLLNSLYILSHSLAGSCGTFGAPHASTIASQLERLFEECHANIDHFDNCSERITNLINQLMNLSSDFRKFDLISIESGLDEINPSREQLIYLVDDDLDFALALKTELEQAGHQVEIFSNLAEFEDACNLIIPTTLIVDMVFADDRLGGAHSVNNLKSILPPELKTIFVSQRDDIEARLMAVRAGGDAYFKKPLDITSLLQNLKSPKFNKNNKRNKILIIDDDEIICEILKAILEAEGLNVRTLSNPLESLEVINSFEPDLLILDIYMPQCSGIELAKVLRQSANLDNIPIIFVSSETEDEKINKALYLGGDDFFSKPIVPEKLLPIVFARLARVKKNQIVYHDYKVLRKENSLFHNALNKHCLVSETNLDGIITYANSKFCEVSGYTAKELIGNTHAILNSGVHNTDFFSNLWATITKGNIWSGTICNKKKDGNFYWVQSTIIPYIGDNGCPVKYISLRTDISELKKAQEISQELHSLLKRQLSALQKISTNLKMTELGIDNCINEILQETNNALRLTCSSIWTFSKNKNAYECRHSVFTGTNQSMLGQLLNVVDNRYFLDQINSQNVVILYKLRTNQKITNLYQSILAANKTLSIMAIKIKISDNAESFLLLESNSAHPIWNEDEINLAKTLKYIIEDRFKDNKDIQSFNKLLNNEKRLRVSQKYANIGTWDWDLSTGEMVWSEQIAELFDFKNPSISQNFEHLIATIHPSDKQEVIFTIENSIKTGKDFNLEHRILLSDGTERWVSQFGAIIRDSNNNATQILCVVRDIHKRKIADFNVQKQTTLLDIIREGVIQFVKTESRMLISDYLLKGLIKVTESEYGFLGEVLYDDNDNPYFLTHGITDISWNEETRKLYEDNREKGIKFTNLDNLFGRTITSGEIVISNTPSQDMRATKRIPQGHPPMNSFLGVPIYHGDELVGMFGLANRKSGYNTDLVRFLQPFTATYGVIIHAQRMAEKQNQQRIALEKSRIAAEEANEAKSTFLSSMSHELRTPLNAILGFSQLLQMPDHEEPLSESQIDYISEINRAGKHLLDLINEILDLSRIESGRLDLKFDNISLSSLFNQCESLIKPLCNNKNVNLVFDNNDVLVFSDLKRLKQILINLISNAVKYNKDSGTVWIKVNNNDSNNIQIDVIDNGIGIPLTKQKELFTSFNRLGAENTGIEGTGIGLVITKKLVELMGGTIEFESTVGEGSKFRVTLPKNSLKTSRNDFEYAELDSSILNTKNENKKILYLEDNAANMRLISHLFSRRKNIKLYTFSSPTEALYFLEDNSMDLILLDINLPEMDGYAFYDKLKQYDNYNNCPVIGVSAGSSENDIQKGLNAGFFDYLTKPININSFFVTIDSALNSDSE